MTAALSAPLQQALYTALAADGGLVSLIGAGRVFDAPPHRDGPDAVAPPYVVIGDERVTSAADKSSGGAVHELSVAVVSDAEGYLEAKQAAAAVSDLIDAGPLTLSRGAVIRQQVLGAVATRETGGVRRLVTLRLRFTLEDA